MEAKMASEPSCCRFSVAEIRSATQNFDDALVIGEGGFGKVYKATINVQNGATCIVAIKRLDSGSNQGAHEFWAEIEMLTKLRHCNLVSLIGYCNDESEMILVYEFMPHGTLDGHLHKYGTSMSWVQRLKISIGAARGLHYLHTGTGTQHGVIHRDVKSSNILLDEDYAAKISDFGLSKISPITTSGTYVNTLIKGTFGYFDPEYFMTGRLTRKSDVFSFGVVLFELLCGRVALDRSLDDDRCSLSKWVLESIEKGKVDEIIDSNIKSEISQKCLKVFLQIADRCLNSESKNRPTMAEILAALELSFTLQNKFDTRVIKSPGGIMSIAKMIKWPFVSTEFVSPQSVEKHSNVNDDENPLINHAGRSFHQAKIMPLDHKDNIIDHTSATKEQSDHDHLEVVVSSAEKIQILVHDLKKFSLDDLQTATRNFRRRLGGGEFADVFKGWIAADTDTSSLQSVDGILRICVKRFYHSKIQHHLKEKFVDMTFLSEFDHPNLVEVLGYCFEDKKLFLVYEFMENGSLESHLFSKHKTPLEWRTRVEIAKGVAEALLFLHRTQTLVQNRPIELRHILLDKHAMQYFNPKLSGFESARLVYGHSYVEINDYLLYYRVPPYKSVSEGIVRPFGVVLFQILTGERDISYIHQNMARRKGKHRKECLRRELDPRLPNVNDITIKEAMQMAEVALSCLDHYSCSYTLEEALDVLQQL